jgi:putative transcriptional regulator
MAYKPIEIDRKNLTIMGVRFSDIDTLNSAANAIGSNMFEGFEPTPRLVEIYRDYREGKIQSGGFIEMLRGAV